MKVWDMHCDTLAELRYAQQAGKPKSFLHNDLMMDLERTSHIHGQSAERCTR